MCTNMEETITSRSGKSFVGVCIFRKIYAKTILILIISTNFLLISFARKNSFSYFSTRVNQTFNSTGCKKIIFRILNHSSILINRIFSFISILKIFQLKTITLPKDDLNYLYSQLLLYPNNSSFLSNYNAMIEQIP